MIVPSAWWSSSTSAAPSRTGRSGADGALMSRIASATEHLLATLLQKILQPRLGVVAALGDRRHQRFGEQSARRIALGDPRQHVHDREVGKRRIGRDALRQFNAFGEASAVID